MDLIVDLDWTENALKCWIGLRNGLGIGWIGIGWIGLCQNIWTGLRTVPNYVKDLVTETQNFYRNSFG